MDIVRIYFEQLSDMYRNMINLSFFSVSSRLYTFLNSSLYAYTFTFFMFFYYPYSLGYFLYIILFIFTPSYFGNDVNLSTFLSVPSFLLSSILQDDDSVLHFLYFNHFLCTAWKGAKINFSFQIFSRTRELIKSRRTLIIIIYLHTVIWFCVNYSHSFSSCSLPLIAYIIDPWRTDQLISFPVTSKIVCS